MQDHFLITRIHRIIMVDDKDEYPDKITEFSSKLTLNELIYHISGKTSILFGGKQLDTKPNTIRLLPKGEFGEYVVDRIEAGSCIDVFFDTDVSLSNEAFVCDGNNKKISELFKKIFAKWVSREEGYYFECLSLLYKIFAEMQKTRYATREQATKIQPAVDYIHNHFMKERICSEKLSELCGVSYSYLRRLFISEFGTTPKKYAVQLKINHACDLLRSKRFSVTQISNMLGYESVSFFSRQFKEYSGISPTAFLQKYRSSK